MKINLKHILIAGFFFLSASAQGQYFMVTLKASGTNAQVVITPYSGPGGGNITTDFSLFEFFFRVPTTVTGLTFGAPVSNTTDFPNLNIQPAPSNPNQQGVEPGYNNYWFISSLSVFTTRTYNVGTEYVLATIPILISGTPTNPTTITGFELINNTDFVPHYLTLTSATGGNELTARVVDPNNQVFYASPGVSSIGVCPCGAGSGVNMFARLATGLPVTFTAYDVKCNDKGALLTWATSTEQNSDRFEIQRSSNGIDWITVDHVAAAGNSSSTKNYQYLDLKGGSFQYRIRQVDIDGRFVYTAVKQTNCKSTAFDVALYPVPATDKLTVVIRTEKAVRTELQIVDMAGKTVQRVPTQVNSGNNNINLNIANLPAGQYMLVSGDPSIIINKKFTIMR